MKYLLIEDDCTPDSREYFIKRMKEDFNINFDDFLKYGIFAKYNDGFTMEWYYNGYILSIDADDSFYKLRRRNEC